MCCTRIVAATVWSHGALPRTQPGLVGSAGLSAWLRPGSLRSSTLKPVIVLYTGWVTLSLLTPFYHPYARLWLPLEAFGWLFMAGVLRQYVDVAVRSCAAGKTLGGWLHGSSSDPLLVVRSYLLQQDLHVQAAVFGFIRETVDCPACSPRATRCESASAAIARDLPKIVQDSSRPRPAAGYVLPRPDRPASPIERQPSLSELLQPGDGTTWALLDMAIIRQDQGARCRAGPSSRPAGSWYARFPRNLSLPVLLDIDPGDRKQLRDAGPQVELRLMRPKRAGDLQ